MSFTINNTIIPNFSPTTNANTFNQVWKLTRALKKAGYKYLGSGNSTSKNTSGDPAADLWNNAPATSNAGASNAAVVATPARGRAVVTGLSGIVSTDKGRYLVISGSSVTANNNQHQIEEILSSTSVSIDARTFAVGVDATPRTWSIKDPNNDTYLSTLAANTAWWLGRGPSTLKVPFTASITLGPTGLSFIRGENVVQSTTGAEGEIIGVLENGSSSYVVISPRLRGTGSGIYGWDTANNLTGAISGAVVAQSGTTLEYRNEVMFHKAANETTGTITVCIAEPVGEATLASLLGSSGCTASVPPGGGGTGNTFPSFAWLVHGQTTSGTHSFWGLSNSGTYGNAQIVVKDCIEEQNYSADGSWFFMVAQTAQVSTVGYHGVTFSRLDDTEPGDIHPYVTYGPVNLGTLYNNNRTTGGNVTSGGGWGLGQTLATSSIAGRGWRARGSVGDSSSNFQELEIFSDFAWQTSAGLNTIQSTNVSTVLTAATLTKVGFEMRIGSSQANRKMKKGKFRYLTWVDGGNANTLYNNKTQIQLSSATGAFVLDGWDGTTSAISQNT